MQTFLVQVAFVTFLFLKRGSKQWKFCMISLDPHSIGFHTDKPNQQRDWDLTSIIHSCIHVKMSQTALGSRAEWQDLALDFLDPTYLSDLSDSFF